MTCLKQVHSYTYKIFEDLQSTIDHNVVAMDPKYLASVFTTKKTRWISPIFFNKP
jgi:hypothetical protein